MNETIKNLIGRRSCRAYQEKQITDAELDTILEVGTYAPTAMGKQSPLIVAIRDKETLRQVEKLNGAVMGQPDGHPFYGAPTVVIVFGDTSVPFGVSDGNLVIGNILNAANAVGIDSCYIWRAKETFESEEGKALKAKWGIPENYEGVGNVILGYGKPEGKRNAPPRKPDYIKIIG